MSLSPEEANSTSSDRETARKRAKADLVLALYWSTSHELERTRHDLERTRDEARTEIERLSGRLDDKHSEIDRVTRERDASRAELHNLEQRYQALLNSTSWRMTAPIRTLSRIIGRQ